MIKLEIEIDDIDYGALAKELAPMAGDALRSSGNPLAALLQNGAAGPVARAVLDRTPKGAKDKLAAELIDSNSWKLISALEQAAARKGVRLRIGRIHAEPREE